MNPKHISVRMDQNTGELWLTEEKYMQPPKRLKQITGDVILALAAEIIAVDDTRMASREVKFSDGVTIRITVEEIRDERHDDLSTEPGEMQGRDRHGEDQREPAPGKS